LPGFPDPAIQSQFVGSSNEQALNEAYVFYTHVKGYCTALGMPLNQRSNVLDFGVGWGRILRFFLKDVDEGNLFGVDVDPNILEICRKTGLPGVFSQVGPTGPMNFDDESFNLVYAYSVFSHLSEEVHLRWIEEISRILKPGGVFIATTEARSFIEFCSKLHDGKEEIKSKWHRALSTAFPNPNKAFEIYDAGGYIFVPTGGGDFRDSSFYGEALVPKEYVKKYWTKQMHFREFIDDRNRFWQAVIIMQKA
jgi:SAM-dependent methyltransferase